MKDIFTNVTEFIKSLMQPAITLVMAWVFLSYALRGIFSVDQVWQVVVGVLIFWFGYTAIKNFNFTGAGNGKEQSPKANGGGISTVTTTPYKPPEGYTADGLKIEPKEEAKPVPEVPFDADNLMSMVDSIINNPDSPNSNEPDNAFTRARTAKRILARGGLGIRGKQAVDDAYDYLFELTEKEFEEIWGCSYETAISKLGKKAGCPKCPGSVAECKPKTIDQMADYSGVGFRVSLDDIREAAELAGIILIKENEE